MLLKRCSRNAESRFFYQESYSFVVWLKVKISELHYQSKISKHFHANLLQLELLNSFTLE